MKLRTLDGTFSWRAEQLEWPVTTDVKRGLDGVIASTTRVTWLDPSSGVLWYRGVPIEELAGRWDFEMAAYLLISGRRPDDDDEGFKTFRTSLRNSRQLPKDVRGIVRDLPPDTHPTRLLRAGVSALGCHELTAQDDLGGERHWRELRIVGQVPALVAEVCCHRRSRSTPPVQQTSSLSRSLLEAMNGRPPTRAEQRSLDLLWVLYAAHGMDAPTFTSMIVASCLADPYYNIVAGLSAMRGFRQGGAGEMVLEQLLNIRTPDEGRRWVHTQLRAGGRIGGFGHRHYRMPDPRVVILRKEVAVAARRQGRDELFAVARAVEEEATRELAGRGLHVNINFYSALLFHLLGADGPLIPCLFAVSRMAGLVALVRESLDEIRLYRPLSRYVGADRRAFPWVGRS